MRLLGWPITYGDPTTSPTPDAYVVYVMKNLIYFPICRHQEQWYSTATKCESYASCEKNAEKRFQKCGLSTVLLKRSHGLSFLWVPIFRFICESDFWKDPYYRSYSFLLEWNKKKYAIFSKMQSICFSAMKITRNAVKIIAFDDNTEISTVKIELLPSCTDNMGHYFNI